MQTPTFAVGNVFRKTREPCSWCGNEEKNMYFYFSLIKLNTKINYFTCLIQKFIPYPQASYRFFFPCGKTWCAHISVFGWRSTNRAQEFQTISANFERFYNIIKIPTYFKYSCPFTYTDAKKYHQILRSLLR